MFKNFFETCLIGHYEKVVARRETRIRPKVSGRIESILVDEGDNVDAEQVLVRLEQEDFLLAKHRAEVALSTANAALKQLLAGTREKDIQHVIVEGNYGLEDGTKIRKLDEE